MIKKILAIDIDETILNIEPLFFLEKFKKDYKKQEGKLISFTNTKKQFYISLRPGARQFLEEAKKHFRLVAFSVVDQKTTVQKLRVLDIHKQFEKVYGREDLINKQKCLETISKDFDVTINNIIAIDDNPQLFDFQERVVKISPWFIGSEADPEELLYTLEQAKLM